MKTLLSALLFFAVSASQAAPIQPSDLADDDRGDMDIAVMACLSGLCDLGNLPVLGFMTLSSNVAPTQLEIDAADKIPLFDPFADAGFIIDDIQVERTPAGFVYGTDGGAVITPDQWIQLLVFDGNQWLADIGMDMVGEDAFILDFPTQDQLLVIDANAEDIVAAPLPAAAWLFGAGLLGLVGVARRS